MLFADSDVAAGASVVACLLAAITGLFSWLTARDKLRFDGEIIRLKLSVENLTSKHQDCEEKHDLMRGELNELRRRVGSGHHRPLDEQP